MQTRVSPGFGRGLWVMTCLSGFISNQWAALVGTSVVRDLCTPGWGRHTEVSHPFFKFVMNLKLLKKKKGTNEKIEAHALRKKESVCSEVPFSLWGGGGASPLPPQTFAVSLHLWCLQHRSR